MVNPHPCPLERMRVHLLTARMGNLLIGMVFFT